MGIETFRPDPGDVSEESVLVLTRRICYGCKRFLGWGLAVRLVSHVKKAGGWPLKVVTSHGACDSCSKREREEFRLELP